MTLRAQHGINSLGRGMKVYKMASFPSDDLGNDGDFALLMADMRFVDNGTIIPVQSDMTNCFGSSTAIWQAFDGNTSTIAGNAYQNPYEFGYDFGEGNEKSICSVSMSYYSCGIWFRVRASNDRKNWKTLAVCNGSWYGTATISVTFNNDQYYRYYSVILYHNGVNGNNYVQVSEIGMTDDRSVMKEPNTPVLLTKRLGIWNYDMLGTAFDCEPAVVYRVNGRNPSTSISTYVGQVSSDLNVELDGAVDPSLFTQTSWSAFFGWNNNAQCPFKIRMAYNGNRTSFNLNIGNSSTSGIEVNTSTLLASSTFKIRINKDNWSLYMDDVLVNSATVGGWTDTTNDWDVSCNVLGGTYNTAASSQLGFKRLKIIDNKYDRIVCDIVGAKRTLDGTIGFVDRNIGCYFGYDANYVKAMVR